jgi:DNA-binding response OmpR family regulator
VEQNIKQISKQPFRQVVAIVEDDIEQRSLYVKALQANDYDVIEFSDRQSAIDSFEESLPDLVILDIALGVDVGGGFEVCRYLQQRDAGLPVIFLTSRGDELDKIYGLQLGAWDYQTKPVSLEYLLVRIASFFNIKQLSQVRTAEEKDDTDIARDRLKTVGSLSINESSMQCYWGQHEIVLTPTEFSILIALVDKDEAVSIEELVRATRQGLVEDNTINTHILHIRKKFRKVDADFQCIKTRYGFGYQWLCR